MKASAIAVLVVGVLVSASATLGDSSRLRKQIILPDGVDAVKVPLARSEDYLLVKASVNGEEVGWLLLDTGLTGATIALDSKLVERLKLPKLGELKANAFGGKEVPFGLYSADDVSFGGIHLRNGLVSSANLSSLPFFGKKLSGLIGLDLLREMPVTLDWREPSINFHRAGKMAAEAATRGRELELRLLGAMILPASVDGIDAWFLLDTGAGSTNVDLFAGFARQNHHHFRKKEHTIVNQFPGLGGTLDVTSMRLDSVSIGGTAAHDVRATMHKAASGMGDLIDLGCAGILGSGLFSDARVTFDFEHDRAWVQWLEVESDDAYSKRAEVEAANDVFGDTLLIRVLCDGRWEIARRLIERGIDVGGRDTRGYTALMLAVGDAPTVKLLLSKGADPNTEADWKAETALRLAAERGKTESVKLLLAAGAQVNQANTLGHTALLRAAEANYPEAVEILLQAKADVNQADKEGLTPLRYAVGMRAAEAFRILLRAKPMIDARAKDGYTPLIQAAAGGEPELVSALLEAGAKVDGAGDDGITPLMAAADTGQERVVRLLLKAGADPTLKTKNGNTAWTYALLEGFMDVLQELPMPALPKEQGKK